MTCLPADDIAVLGLAEQSSFERARAIVRASNAITPSTALLHVEEEIRRGDSTAARFAGLIDGSPELAARVLRVANSGFYAPQQSVSTLRRAVAILGDVVLRQLVIASIAMARRSRCQSVWQSAVAARLTGNAVRAAVICRELGELTGRDPEAAFAAGLLHDLGRLYLLDQTGDAYAELAFSEQMDPHPDVERRICGASHEDVGAVLAVDWSLPGPIGAVLAAHHGSPLPGSLAELVWLGDRLVAELTQPVSAGRHASEPAAPTMLRGLLQIDQRVWAERVPKVKEEMACLLQAFD